jgi:cell division transport system ATP-binding protein
MIELYHVSKRYHNRRLALDDITLKIEKGEFVFIAGPSGAGKTTLFKLLYGLEQADHGQILIFNRNIARLTAASLPYLRRSLGFVFQDFRLLRQRTVFNNVALPLKVTGGSRSHIQRRVQEVLNWVGLGQKAQALPLELSAGEQQRVCIARAIVGDPMILLADEPTGNLDRTSAGEILELFKAIHTRGTTVVIATHQAEEIQGPASRLIPLRAGRILG